jgi:hypothetical protein
MKSWLVVRAAVGLTVMAVLPGTALAQAAWAPGSELVGQPIQVTTNGVTNTVTLSPGGQAQITSVGGTVVNGTWTAANGQMCLNNGTAQECWPYTAPFQAGAPQTLTSSCNSTSTWLAQATNQPPPPPPTQGQRGERGF